MYADGGVIDFMNVTFESRWRPSCILQHIGWEFTMMSRVLNIIDPKRCALIAALGVKFHENIARFQSSVKKDATHKRLSMIV
jgi:hypothetical protein